MRKFRWLGFGLFLVVLIASAAGCSKQPPDKQKAENIQNEKDNPFKTNKEDTVVMGSIGHGFMNPATDENGKMLPLQYDGGEMQIDYYVNASGKAKNVGFLVFVDGIPQPYKFNKADASYEYMHMFDLEEDDKDTPFTFIFTPVTGKKGDTLNVSITSVYNPAFMPDMKETSSYGGYHDTLLVTNSVVFKKDADALDASDIPKYDYLGNIRQSAEPVTKELLDKQSAMRGVDLETLEKQILSELYFDGESAMKLDNLQVSESGSIHVTLKLFGHPGVKFQNTFYINHHALTTKDGDSSFETVLAKGEAAVVEVEIDLERLEDLNTFYVVSVPMNAEDFPEDVIVLEKTRSILIYK